MQSGFLFLGNIEYYIQDTPEKHNPSLAVGNKTLEIVAKVTQRLIIRQI